jgi:hypothetical protein
MSEDVVTIRLPVKPFRKAGRKWLIASNDATLAEKPIQKPDKKMITAIIRGFRWRYAIETGKAQSIRDLAKKESLTDAYVVRVMTLTCLAPDIIESILNGTQPRMLRLEYLIKIRDMDWDEQRKMIAASAF